jgi:hypothetical protein
MGFLLWNVFHMTLLPDMKDFDVKANGESAPSARAVPSRGRRNKGFAVFRFLIRENQSTKTTRGPLNEPA